MPTMRAVVLREAGLSRNLAIREACDPHAAARSDSHPHQGVRLNRSELHTRIGLAQGVNIPAGARNRGDGCRHDPGDSGLAAGHAGRHDEAGWGAVFDGGYAEYVVVPADQAIPFTSKLGWDVLARSPRRCRRRTAR